MLTDVKPIDFRTRQPGFPNGWFITPTLPDNVVSYLDINRALLVQGVEVLYNTDGYPKTVSGL
jgi:hypothetical protein